MVKYLVLIVFLISGCHYGINGTEPAFTKPQAYTTDEGVVFNVTPVKKIGNTSVSGDLTVLYLEISNKSENTIFLEKNDMVLIDERNVQYNSLDPAFAANIIRESSPVRIYPRFSIGIGTGYFSDHHYFHGYHRFPPFRGYPYYYDDYYYDDYYYREQNVDYVYRNALVPGNILPGATLSGFVYFKKVPRDVSNVKFHTGYGIKDTDTTKEITFDLVR